MNEPTYTPNTTLAFIDILGFKSMLSNKPLPEIVDTINSILHFDNSADYKKMLPTLNTKLISDSFIVYAQLRDANHVTAFYVYLLSVIANVHKLGKVMTRGYVSNGEHYFNDEMWISPVFLEAYLGEQYTAIYPRVVIGELAIVHANNLSNNFISPGFFSKDTDGQWFMNYMQCIGNNYKPNVTNIIADINSKGLEPGLFSHKDAILFGFTYEKKHFKKYNWLANYHNDYINKCVNTVDNSRFLIDIDQYSNEVLETTNRN
ncbi:MAG: hypothetical protein V9F05_15720 [Chitinophagaceae bacterium]